MIAAKDQSHSIVAKENNDDRHPDVPWRRRHGHRVALPAGDAPGAHRGRLRHVPGAEDPQGAELPAVAVQSGAARRGGADPCPYRSFRHAAEAGQERVQGPDLRDRGHPRPAGMDAARFRVDPGGGGRAAQPREPPPRPARGSAGLYDGGCAGDAEADPLRGVRDLAAGRQGHPRALVERGAHPRLRVDRAGNRDRNRRAAALQHPVLRRSRAAGRRVAAIAARTAGHGLRAVRIHLRQPRTGTPQRRSAARSAGARGDAGTRQWRQSAGARLRHRAQPGADRRPRLSDGAAASCPRRRSISIRRWRSAPPKCSSGT